MMSYSNSHPSTWRRSQSLIALGLIWLFSSIALGQICATPGNDGNATGLNALGFGGATVVVNTYYPGTANAAVGATSISVGTSRGSATAIAAGDLLLVIQMQDATINSTDTSSYGDGVSGGSANGTTSDGGAGNYEFVQATGPVASGSVPIQGATVGSGLLNAYVNAAATSSQGQRRFQVIRVPQYDNADVVGTVVPSNWNGRTGGVVAMDVDDTFTFSTGSTVSATGYGFRGGGGRQLTGASGGSNTDYRSASSSAYHAPKGEGIAGTPRYVHESFTGTAPGSLVNTGTGYPNGSHGRGAPGNAGGGGNDGRPSNNDENSGGGGGGNGGTGGMGGNSWNSNLAVGGHGGAAFSSASINRLIMGGGGGAATRNNSSDVDCSGGAGGGLIIIRAGTITGTGTVQANGIEPNAANGLLPQNDGGGGGGAGGTLVVFGNAGSLANITLNADGGDGSDCALTDPAHGPGGGGGGGLIYVNDLPFGTVTTNGGTSGITTTSSLTFGSTNGTAGSSFLNGQITSLQPCGFVPVSLAYFKTSRLNQKEVLFEWVTATETANIGFDLFGFDGRQWTKINSQMIPSNAIDSDSSQAYEFKARATDYSQFAIEDIDRFGKSTRHDGFSIDREYGAKPQLDAINWASISNEHRQADSRRFLGGGQVTEMAITVSKPGMQRIDYESLTQAGGHFNGVAVEDFALFSQGKPIPIRVGSHLSTSQPFFGPGSYIDFFGTVDFSLYAQGNVYQLTTNTRAARRIQVAPETKPFISRPITTYKAQYVREENKKYAFSSPLKDPWYDTQLLALETAIGFDFPFNLSKVRLESGGQLTLRGYGVTDFPIETDHHLRFFLNGQYLGEWFGDGLEVLDRAFAIPSHLLRNGNNLFRIEMPADTGAAADVFHLERFTIDYTRSLNSSADGLTFKGAGRHFVLDHLPTADPVVYGLTDRGWFFLANVPTEATKEGYWQALLTNPDQKGGEVTFFVNHPNALGKPSLQPVLESTDAIFQKADYLIIAHPNFIPGLAPLVQARENQGFRTLIADVTHVYREFSHGNVDAGAIKAYLRYAHGNMGTRFVLLVGGDSYDYKNYLDQGAMSFVPTDYVRTGPLVGFAPSDASLADINRDFVPDMAIGRFPVRTLAELELIINKTLRYPNSQPAHNSLFVAGPDEAGVSFSSYSEHFMGLISQKLSPRAAFVDELGILPTRQKMVDTVNDGLGFLNFFGHSGPTVWTFDNLFSTQHISLLNNVQNPTVIAQWGCWNTYFVAPGYNTLAHRFLLSGPHGAAAVMGASTLTQVSSEKQFAPKLIQELFKPGQTMGQAMMRAKQLTAKDYPMLKDIYLGFQLLGDPAMVLVP